MRNTRYEVVRIPMIFETPYPESKNLPKILQVSGKLNIPKENNITHQIKTEKKSLCIIPLSNPSSPDNKRNLSSNKGEI